MVYLKSFKPQQVMSPTSRLVTCAISQQAPKKDIKNKCKKEAKVVKTTKRWWKEKSKLKKHINSFYTPFIASFQISKRPHCQKNPLAIMKIAKISSKPRKLHLFLQNFQHKPP